MLCLRMVLPAILAVGWMLFLRPIAAPASPEATDKARRFLKGHDERIRPLEIVGNLAWWNANNSGKDDDFKKKEDAQNAIDEALANPKVFAELKALKEKRGDIDDPILARAIDILYLQYLEKQVDTELLKKMSARSNAVEKAFNEFRAKVGGKEMTENEVRNILKNSKNSTQRKEVWEASKKVGQVLNKDLTELVKYR